MRVCERGRDTRPQILRVFAAVATLTALLTLAGPAMAFPTSSTLCDTCHPLDSNVLVTATQTTNDGISAAYVVSVTGPATANGWAVRDDGGANIASGKLPASTFTVPVGRTYTVWGVSDGGGLASSGSNSIQISPDATVITTTTTATTTTSTTTTTTTTTPTTTTTVPTRPHPFFASRLVCDSCHHKKHHHNQGCATCHGPGGNRDVHQMSAHVRSTRTCFICHEVPAAFRSLCCLSCHTFGRGCRDRERGGSLK